MEPSTYAFCQAAKWLKSSARNCLENRDRHRIGVPKAAKRGRSDPIGRFSPPNEPAREAFGHFPNSFGRVILRSSHRTDPMRGALRILPERFSPG